MWVCEVAMLVLRNRLPLHHVQVYSGDTPLEEAVAKMALERELLRSSGATGSDAIVEAARLG